MDDRASRPLNQSAVSAADDELYSNHAHDPRPNALYDEDGNRKPLDANDPDQADLRAEWMDTYKSRGGQTEQGTGGSGTVDQAVMPCEQQAQVDPLIIATPIVLDYSDVGNEDEPESDESEEPESEERESTDAENHDRPEPEPADSGQS